MNDLMPAGVSSIYLLPVLLIVLLLGVALIFSAPESRAPSLLAVLGVVTIVAGLVTPLFGLRRFAALLRWWSERPPALVRAWCVLVLLLGAGLVWAVAPALVA